MRRGGKENIIMDFYVYYETAKKKIKLKLWSVEFAKGYLSCLLDNIAKMTDEQYDECSNMIDEL